MWIVAMIIATVDIAAMVIIANIIGNITSTG